MLNDAPGIADPTRELGGLLKAIAGEVFGKAAGARAGTRSMFAIRIAAAHSSGLSKAQIAAIVRGIRQEMQAALRAAAEQTHAELVGRATAARMEQGGRRKTLPAPRRFGALRQ